MRYRHEDRASKLIEKLYRKEEGIMWAERAAAKIDRDYDKAIRKMNEIKDSMDRAQLRYDAREEGRADEKLAIARKMKEIGDPIEKIHTITGLPAETIERM